MAAHKDGGRSALGGFLYQIVAVLGLRALLESGEDRGDEFSALLSVNGEIRIEHEKFDSDAVVEKVEASGVSISLVQFKYSRLAPPRPIAITEYKHMVTALSKARDRAKRAGHAVSAYYLITNRTLRSVDAASFRAKQARELAKRLRVLTEVGFDRWHNSLLTFGRSFGCDEREIERGIYELVGRVFQSTNLGNTSVERGDLIKAITGHSDAKPIRRDDLEARMIRDLRRVSDDLWLSATPVRRQQWDKISRAIFSEDRAILFLVGDGGSGKSTALVDWLLHQLRNEPPCRPCVSMNRPKSGHASWIAELVADWSDLPDGFRDRREESTDRVIERLVVANRDVQRPILLLGLDGLDETSLMAADHDAVRRILEWFRREDEGAREEMRRPAATLIVTSRELGDIANQFLYHASSGFPPAWKPTTIQFDDFTDDDLREVARTCVWKHVGRFQASMKSKPYGSMATVDDERDDSSSGIDRGSRPIHPDVLASLRHPSMWRAFTSLPSFSQGRALDGDATALASLAKGFTDWFCQKVQDRQKYLPVNVILEALATISRHGAACTAPFEMVKDWCVPAQSAGLARDQARILFYEASSAGYIRSQPRGRWIWRHAFCPEYLRVSTEPGSE